MAVITKVGYEITFKKPIKESYYVEADDKELAISMAFDFAKGRYPNKDWDEFHYIVKEYTYNEIKW